MWFRGEISGGIFMDMKYIDCLRIYELLKKAELHGANY
jgi:hypothetical protein